MNIKSPKLGTKKYSLQKQSEDESLLVLNQVLPRENFDVHTIAGNYPSTDGHVQLINGHREYTGLKFDFQARAINKKNLKSPKVVCDKSFLKSCAVSNMPVVLFGIDTVNKIVHWVHLSPKYIQDLNLKKNQNKKTIVFTKGYSLKISDTEIESAWEKWEKICKAYIETSDLIQQMEGLKSTVEINKYIEKEINRFLYRLGKKINSKYYDEIVNDFSLIESLIYYKKDKDFPIAEFVVNLYPGINENFGHQAIYKNKFGDLEGKNYHDFLVVYLELIKKIRYIKIKEVFNIAVNLSTNNAAIKTEALKLIKEISKFNLFVLEKIGYTPQLEILSVIKKWDEEIKLSNIDANLETFAELLDLETEGVSMSDYTTLTITRKLLTPTPALIRLRADVIKLLFELFGNTKLDTKLKTQILSILQKATHFQHSSQEEMVKKDVRKIVTFYKNNYSSVGLALRLEMESDLAMINRSYKGTLGPVKKLLVDIKNDDLYAIYRMFVGRKIDLIDIDKNYDAITQEITDTINQTVNNIDSANLQDWVEKFIAIADTKAAKDDWEFQDFNQLLEKFSFEKADFAIKVILNSLKTKDSLGYFLPAFIKGLRNHKDSKYLLQVIDQIRKLKQFSVVRSYLISLMYRDNVLIKEEINVLINIANKRSDFKFLNRHSKDIDYLIFTTLLNSYNADKKRLKPLLISFLTKIKQEEVYKYAVQLALNSTNRGGTAKVDITKWNVSERRTVLNRLLDIKQLDFHHQELLVTASKGSLENIVEFFVKRIVKKEGLKEKPFKYSQYDAIPHSLDEPVTSLLTDTKQQEQATKKIIKLYKLNNKTRFGFEFINLLKLVSSLNPNLISLITPLINGNENDLKIVMDILHAYHNEDGITELCLKVLDKTQNEDIIRSCKSIAIGLGGSYSGEHGISEGYKLKLEKLGKVKTINKKRKAFMDDIKSILSEEIVRQRESEDKGIEDRKKEFDMGD